MSDPANDTTPGDGEAVLFESAYGELPKFFWYFILPFLIAASGILYVNAKWFGKGFLLEGTKLTPNFVAWVICPIIWILCALLLGFDMYRRRHPQRVVVADAGLFLPKGRYTDEIVHIPWAHLKATFFRGNIKFWDVYEITCIDTRYGKKTAISSMLFRNLDDFATFALIIGEHMGDNWSIKGFLPGTIRGRKEHRG